MVSIAKSTLSHPSLGRNAVGLLLKDYEAEMSTLCAGCGHDSISHAIIEACWELSIPPHLIVKLSGIGCSSKTPGYFLKPSHGINSVHGRMPSIATGAQVSDSDLYYLGVSGDGDSGSIGIGQFVHAVRRNLSMLYLCANNGTYGLTKGQFSPTATQNIKGKGGDINPYVPIELVNLAIVGGASFVARSFSGDKKQLVPLIKAGLMHRGFAYIEIISPCVTFNSHKESDRSYHEVRKHNHPLFQIVDYVESEKELTVDYDEGGTKLIPLSQNSFLKLSKLDAQYDPIDRNAAIERVKKAQLMGEILTGLIYIDPAPSDFNDSLRTTKQPLRSLSPEQILLNPKELAGINAELKA